MRAPSSDTDIVVVITRTTEQIPGVVHPPDLAIGLNERGVFALRYLRHAEARSFRPPQVEHRGRLPEPYLSQVLDLYLES